MIKYLGSKRQLINQIIHTIQENFPNQRSVLDLFSGTSRVGVALKGEGFQVFANDHNHFAYHLAHCYIETNIEDIPQDLPALLKSLNELPSYEGFFTKNYCENSRFFHPQNGKKIDAIRDHIEKLTLNSKLRSVLLVSLMEAADRVDSTCGIQMSYLKAWAKRALKPLELTMPHLLPISSYGPGKAFNLDALNAAQEIAADVAYLDPPYNQHSYRGNYHIWETLVQWDNPSLYGVAHKRMDCKTFKSNFNLKNKFHESLSAVIDNLQTKNIVLSFSNEGFIDKTTLESLLGKFGRFKVKQIEYKRYVGAQIGIYNRKGEKVGKVKNLHNQEFIYALKKY